MHLEFQAGSWNLPALRSSNKPLANLKAQQVILMYDSLKNNNNNF